jgi:putative peptide zinc metalloprotease protein
VKKLIPLGVVMTPDGRAVGGQRADPMLALKLRAALVPETVVEALTTIFKPLFWPPVVIAVLAGLVFVDGYVFWFHGIAQGLRQVLYEPALMLLILGLIVVSTAFHEVGHATACAYGGARPGVLGAGIYIIWPAFYSDVTDAYRLSKAGRLRTDLGGVYFNTVFMLVVFGVYLWTRYEPLLVMLGLQNFEIIHQFLPFLRLDGYYVVADLTGVPDLFGRVKPILKSVVPGEEPDRRVTELKGWVRLAVTGWVLLMLPLVLYLYAMLILGAPRVFGTAWDSLGKLWSGSTAAAGHGQWALFVFALLQALLLLLPSIGLVAMFFQTGKRVWTGTEGRPVLRGAASVTGVAIAAALVVFWLPRQHNYVPIQPSETGTIPVATASLARVPTLVSAPVQLQQPAQDLLTSPQPTPSASSSPAAAGQPSPATTPQPSPSPS